MQDPAFDDDDALTHDDDVTPDIEGDESDDGNELEDEHPDPPDGDEHPDDADDATDVVEAAPESAGADRHVPLGEILLDYKFWKNPRSVTGLSQPDLDPLAKSILSRTTSNGSGVYAGIMDPVRVVQIQEGKEVVLLATDGQRRIMAARMAGLGPDALVPVVDQEPTPVRWTKELAAQYLMTALEVVGTRAGLSSFELSENAERLRESTDPATKKPYTLAQIAAAIGRSESWVSRILAARSSATKAVLHIWRDGEITDEQFKDLASVKDAGKQKAIAAKAVEARKSGDKSAARAAVKEQREIAKSEAAESKPARGKPPVGAQAQMPATPPRKAMPFAVVEDLLTTTAGKPPTHELVKGVLLGIRCAAGLMDTADLPKPWHTYMMHLHGVREVRKPRTKPDRARSERKPSGGRKRRSK